MSVTSLTSLEFCRNAGGAREAAQHGPVFITDRGQPAHVLLTIADYRRLAGFEMTLAEALAERSELDFDFEAPRSTGLLKPADLD